MGILSNRGRHFKRKWTLESKREYINGERNSEQFQWSGRRKRDNRTSNKLVRFLRLFKSEQLHHDNSRWSLPIFTELSRTRGLESDHNTAYNNHRKRNRYNVNLYPIVICLAQFAHVPVTLAENVGGVSATANPIANSSGSVTNQAIQVLQGPYITNTYGNGVQCQGSTLNVTPYIQFADSRKDPWEDVYYEPQYNSTDFTGRTTQQTITVKNYPWESWYDTRTKADGTRWFPDGEDMDITVDVNGPDGIPDNPGQVLWRKPVRTDMKANQSLNLGLSATLSIPMNKKLTKQCHEAAQAQIGMQTQLTANKRLDFELARLKNCGELKKAGVFFHPASPYHSICADVVVTAPGGRVIPHEHQIPQPTWTPPNRNNPKEEVSLGDSSSLGTFSIGNTNGTD